MNLDFAEFSSQDLDALACVVQNKEVMRFTLDEAMDDHQVREYLTRILENNQSKARNQFEYKVVIGGQFAGLADFQVIRRTDVTGIAEIGYLLLPGFWKRGLGTAVAGRLLHECFEVRGMHKVVASCHAENQGSFRVMEKVGMQKEGVLRKHRYKEGRYVDEFQYGLLREDWSPLPR